ncbi:hypothetical protein [Falsiroseomonas sp. HW251]|uniref:hypothetical protein n=1 Tax=Falsiroseomonas sp. HW251 TaxID=3390998 RepID=UPI003D315E87
MTALRHAAEAIAAGGVGRCFFIHLACDGSATEQDAAVALALGERALGPVAAVEARRAAGPSLLLQAWHEGGGIAQFVLREAPEGGVRLDLDGETGSLRLNAAGRLLRHAAGTVQPVAPQAADMPGDVTRLATLIRAALAQD